MKKDDLEKTVPIDVLDMDEPTRSAKYKTEKKKTSRVDKYEDIELEDEKEELEEIEKLDDTKEIESIEELKESDEEEKKEKKKSKKKKSSLKDKFMALPKKKRIFIFVLFGIVVILILVLILMLVLGGNGEQDKKLKPENDDPIKIIDNFYYKKGSLYFLDENEKEIGSYTCANKDESKCYVAYNDFSENMDISRKYDEEGNIILERVPIIDKNYVFVYDSENDEEKVVNLYSIEEEVVKEKYTNVEMHSDNFVVVEDVDKKGLIKIDEEIVEVIDVEYDDLLYVSGTDNVVVKKSKGYVVINKNEAELSKYIESELIIKYYNDDFIIVNDGTNYAVYNYKGEELVSDLEFATVYDEYVALVKKNEVFIRDKDNVKYNESGYKLNNDVYVKKVIYDKDGNLLKKEQSFELVESEEEGELQLLVYRDEEPKYYTIDVLEALANVKYEYINYFNKKLYFYKDEFKEELIGSVSCTNENEITNADDKFESCNVANDTIYETNDMVTQDVLDRKSTVPIIYEKYVFVKDGKDIKLYDLTDSKKAKGTYSSVSSYTINNDNVLEISNNDTYVVAMNKKGKYGLLNITKDNVEALVTFEYSSMEVVGDFVVGKKSASSYDLYKLGSDTALVTIPGLLKGYSVDKRYMKYVVDDSYVVADFQGTELNSDKYDYVELYNGYYVGITKKKLDIYSYSGEKITKESLNVGNYSYVRTVNPAFKVSKKDSNYVVNIYNGSGYDENIYNTTINSYGNEMVVPGEKKEETESEIPKEENETEESGS